MPNYRSSVPYHSALFVLFLAAACSALGDSASTTSFGPDGNSGGGGAVPPVPPPEVELESNFLAPVATKRFVWIANPKSGRVAFVNASTLEIALADAGNGPTYLTAVPGADDTALVLNTLSKDATLLTAVAGANGQASKLEAKTFSVAAFANGWSLSTNGRWAIAWADYRKENKPAKTKGFQDVTVIDLSGKLAPKTLAVGYRPVSVSFAADASEVYAVTQDGISVISLGDAPSLSRNLLISSNPLEDPGTRDVSVTPNGAYAFVRRDNEASIGIVDLKSGIATERILPGPVTDLDLSSDGKSAVAVVRSLALVAVMQVPEIVSDPLAVKQVTVTGETVGSVSLSPQGRTALLYSNATSSSSERLTILNLPQDAAPLTYRTLRLYSPVLSVFSSFDAAHALVIHQGVLPGAFSLVPVQNTLPAKIVETLAAPTAVAFAESNDRVIIAERGAKEFGCYLGKLPDFSITRYPLASPPLAVGILSQAKRAYISQEHPDGRISFIDLETGLARTLTGFELGARISDGSK
jgi:hypothetical protein